MATKTKETNYPALYGKVMAKLVCERIEAESLADMYGKMPLDEGDEARAEAYRDEATKLQAIIDEMEEAEA